jgi:hypothetical protein
MQPSTESLAMNESDRLWLAEVDRTISRLREQLKEWVQQRTREATTDAR